MSLAEGETTQGLVCPACGGGRTGERKFYVKRENGKLVYVCHRATCDLGSGRIDTTRGGFSYGDEAPVKTKKKVFDITNLKPTNLQPSEWEYLNKKFRIPMGVLMVQGFQWCEWLDRVLIPIRDLDGKSEGWVARVYPDLLANPNYMKFDKLKSIDFFRGDEPLGLSVTKGSLDYTDLVLVEDYWSALRINQHIRCISLGGTNLSERVIQHLIKHKVHNLIIVLDPDARVKARKMLRRHQLAFKCMAMLPLNELDPKDMTEAQLILEVINPIKELIQ